jgi:CubicO group peptidase (beta-lactamase class C family)
MPRVAFVASDMSAQQRGPVTQANTESHHGKEDCTMYRSWLRHTCIAALGIVLAGGGCLPGQARVPANPLGPPNPLGPAAPVAAGTPATAWPDTHALTAEDLAAFLDGLMPQQLKRENIAGAVVLVVKDGTVLFQKGYGYADVKDRTPMSAEHTLIRPGSVSKLFTWTAVMQQVELGKIDLDRNVNDYLDFKIPDTYPQPITMRELMTHTAGFEEAVKDLIVGPRTKTTSIGEYLRTHIPARVYPPGTTPAYSNYGATLAGYIVERVSGVPFDEYVEKNIFAPLAMQHTTFEQPLPAAWQPLMSKGYALGSEAPKPFETIGAVPAGSSSTSAVDISHFMLAHLQGGQWNGVRILKPETIALMHSPQFAVDPALEHMCLGFYQEDRNGHGIIGHGGDTQFFHSDLHLIQDANVGFFVSYNSVGRGEINPRSVLFQAFLDRYFPYTVPPMPTVADAVRDSKLVEGEYISSRRAATNILSFFWMFGNLKVVANADGTLVSEGFKSENQVPKTWREIGPRLYRETDGQDRIGFTQKPGEPMVLSVDYPFEVSTRVSFIDSKNFNLFLIGLVAIVSICTLLFWPLSAWIRKHYRHPLALTGVDRRWRLAIRLVMLVDLIYMTCWVSLLSGGQPLFDSSLDPKLRLIQLLGWVGTLGTLVVLLAVVRTWRAPGEWRFSHLGNLLIVASALSFSWFLLHWHLLHFSLIY